MIVHSVAHHGPVRTWAASAQPTVTHTASAVPLDGVTLSGKTYPASQELADTAAETAVEAASQDFYASLSMDQVRQLAESLEEAGVKMSRKGRFLFWLTDWKNSSVDETAKLAGKDKVGRLSASVPGVKTSVPVHGRGDLAELDAFYGSKDLDQVADKPLAESLRAIVGANASLQVKNDEYYYSSMAAVEPYEAYNLLGHDPNWHTKPVTVSSTGFTGTLQDSQDAILASYLMDLTPGDGLADPQAAAVVKGLHKLEARLGSATPIEAYGLLRKEKPEWVTTVKYNSFDLMKASAEEMHNPGEFLPRLKERIETYDRLMDKVGYQAATAFQCVEGSEDWGPREARVSLAERLFSNSERSGAWLYGVVTAAGPPEQAEDLADLALRVQKAALDGREKAWDVALGLEGEFRERYLQVLELVQAAGPAQQAFEALSGDVPTGLEVLGELSGDDGRSRGRAAEAVEALAGDYSPERVGLMKRLMAAEDGGDRWSRRGPHAPQAFRFAQTLPEDFQPLFTELFSQHSDFASTRATWEAVSALGPERVPECLEAWRTLREGVERGSQSVAATQAFQQIVGMEGELSRNATLYRMVLEGAGGSQDRAAEIWEGMLEQGNPELQIRLFAATGDAEEARTLLARLQADSTPAADQPLPVRTEALARLRGATPEAATEYEFAALWSSGDDILDVASLHARLIEQTGSVERSRVALAALHSSPFKDREGSGERLLAALTTSKNFALARDVWESLEERPERLPLVASANAVAAGAGDAPDWYHRLAEAPPSDGGQSLAALVKDVREPERVQKAFDLVLSEPDPEARTRTAASLATLAQDRRLDWALESWPLVAGEQAEPDFAQRLDLLKRLRAEGDELKQRYELVKAERNPGEELGSLADLMVKLGREKFQSVRLRLDRGTVETGEKVENTQFLVQGLARGAELESLMTLLSTPVATEPTSLRRQRVLEVLEQVEPGNLPAAWKAITSGARLDDEPAFREDLSAWQQICGQMGADAAGRALAFIHEKQDVGSLKLSTQEAATELCKSHALANRRQSLQEGLKQLLRNDEEAKVIVAEDEILVGDQRLGIST